MARGRLEPPILDDRTWAELVEEARRLVPAYAPEHTDLSPSDPLMALIELFAWLVEGMTYRLNRVTERNYVAFLDLIGVTRDPASPASLWLTYDMAPGQPAAILAKGSRAQTPQVDETPPVVFETDEDLSILPANVVSVVSIGKVVFNKYNDVTGAVSAPPLSGLSLAIAAGDSQMIALGFDAAPGQPMTLRVRLRRPAAPGDAQLSVRFSQGALAPGSWPAAPGVTDETGDLTQTGLIVVPSPAGWAGQSPDADWSAPGPGQVLANSEADTVTRSLFWLGLRISNLAPTPIELEFEHILFNSVPATNALTIRDPEFLGDGDGQAFQSLSLANRPVFKDVGVSDAYGHVAIEVREPVGGGLLGPWQAWTRIEDFPDGDQPVFRLDPVTGDILFGDFDPASAPEGRGRRPAVGAEIRAASYRWVAGGASGNLAPGAVTVPLDLVAGVTAVRNASQGLGGSDEEDIEDALRRGPETLRNRDRAVTAEDIEYLAREATTDVAIVRALPPRLWTTFDTLPVGVSVDDPWTFGGLNRSVSNVNVVIVPDETEKVPQPQPSPELIREVSDALTARRIITSNLTVTGARYLPIDVNMSVRVFPQAVARGLVADPAISNAYRDELLARIDSFFHPVRGKGDGSGWQVGEDVSVADLFLAVEPDSEIGFVESIEIEAAAPLYAPSDRPFPIAVPSVWIRIADYELVCSGSGHNVTVTEL